MFGRLDPDFLREKALRQSRNIEGEFVPEVARLDLPGMDADIPAGRGPKIGQLHDPDRPSFDLPSQSEIDTINRTGQLPDRPASPPRRLPRVDSTPSGGRIGRLYDDRPTLDLPSEADIDYFQRTGKFPARAPKPPEKSKKDIARDNMRRNRAERGDRPHTPEEEEAALAWMDEMVAFDEPDQRIRANQRVVDRSGEAPISWDEQLRRDKVTARGTGGSLGERRERREAKRRLAGQEKRNQQEDARRARERGRPTDTDKLAWSAAFRDDFSSKEYEVGQKGGSGRGPRDDRAEMIAFYEGRIERAKKEQKKNAGKKGYNPWPAQQEQKAYEQRLDDFKRNGPPLSPGVPARDSRPMMPDRSERVSEGAGSSGWEQDDWFELPTVLPKPETAKERRQTAREVRRRKGERAGVIERDDTDLIAAQARYDDLAGQRKLLQDEIDAELDRSAPNLIRVDIMREQAAAMDQDLEYAGANVEGGLVRREIGQWGESREWGEAYDALGAAETDRAQAPKGPGLLERSRQRRQVKKAERAQQDQERRAARDANTARGREKILAERKKALQEELNGFGWMQGNLDGDDQREAALRDQLESVERVIGENDQVRRDSDLWMESDDERRRRLLRV